MGAAGGIVGGFSAFPGSMPVVYLGLRGLGKAETRGITQPYILALQLVSLSILALTHSAIFDTKFWLLWALTLPAVLLGSFTGVALYRRMSEVNFRRAVLILLIVSGVSLVAKALIRVIFEPDCLCVSRVRFENRETRDAPLKTNERRRMPYSIRVDETRTYVLLYTPEPALTERARRHWDNNCDF